LKKTIDKQIQVLSDREHLRLRPTMYVGGVNPTQEVLPVIKETLTKRQLDYSVGLYRIFEEVVDNSVDEVLRCSSQGKTCERIVIHYNTSTNRITVEDFGQGFSSPNEVNPKSGLGNVETAVTFLRAGSNFHNAEFDENLIGMNGIGLSATFHLSQEFQIETFNGKDYTRLVWLGEELKERQTSLDEKSKSTTGTRISYVPDAEIFGRQKYNPEVLLTKILFLRLLMRLDRKLKSTLLSFFVDDKEQDLTVEFLPKEMMKIPVAPQSLALVWPTYPDSISVGFVNRSMCTGVHQKLIQEGLNSVFGYDSAHQFYNTLVIANLPPKVVVFGDQNKTRLVSGKSDVAAYFSPVFSEEIKQTAAFKEIQERIEENILLQDIKKIKSAKRKSKVKISDKFFSSKKPENLFIVEGQSAAGGVLQSRNPQTDSVYTLKGKIKNARKLSDLGDNTEIIDLIAILGLDIQNQGGDCRYKKIIIATDADPDGKHISSLIINFFYKFFRKIISRGQLYILKTPLASVEEKTGRKYYFNIKEIGNTTTRVRYLKGLGSNDLKDWNYIFTNMVLERILLDSSSKEYLDLAFGDSIMKRKTWLSDVRIQNTENISTPRSDH